MSTPANPTYVRQKDINAKKRLLRDFGFPLTQELEYLLESAESDIQRENLVLGIIHHKFDVADAYASAIRTETARKKRFGNIICNTTKETIS